MRTNSNTRVHRLVYKNEIRDFFAVMHMRCLIGQTGRRESDHISMIACKHLRRALRLCL